MKKTSKTVKTKANEKATFNIYYSSSPVAPHEKYVKEYEDISNLTYDEVEIDGYANLEKVYPEKYYPGAEIQKITVVSEMTHGEEWPLYCEDDKESKKNKPCLVLPAATYSLTPEMSLFLKLQENKCISEKEEFDYDKMHEIIESIK